MIRKLFLPDAIKGYYLVPQRIVGFELGRHVLHATVVLARGKTRIVEQCIEEPFEGDPTQSYHDRASAAIKRTLTKIGSYDIIRSAAPSSQVIFKELSLPFISIEKIRMILPFEIEGLLPFPSQDAIVDCVITKQEITKDVQQSTVMIAAVRREYVEDHQKLFITAGVSVDSISIDLFELIGFLQEIDPKIKKQSVVLLDLSVTTTRIIFLVNEQLKTIRVLNKGISHLAKSFAQNENLSYKEALDLLVRTGLSENSPLKKYALSFYEELAFAIQNLSEKNLGTQKLDAVIISGTGADIPGIVPFFNELTGNSCELFPTSNLAHNISFARNLSAIPHSMVASLAIALSSPLTASVNLLDLLGDSKTDRLVDYQIITGIILTGFLLIGFSMYSFFALRTLSNEAFSSESQASQELKKVFTGIKAPSLSTAIKNAQAELTREESIWYALSPQNRSSFLTCLQELSTRIDRPALDLDIKKMVFVSGARGNQTDTIAIEGSVKDWAALQSLQESLSESKLFTNVPRIEDTRFNITLTLDKQLGAQ